MRGHWVQAHSVRRNSQLGCHVQKRLRRRASAPNTPMVPPASLSVRSRFAACLAAMRRARAAAFLLSFPDERGWPPTASGEAQPSGGDPSGSVRAADAFGLFMVGGGATPTAVASGDDRVGCAGNGSCRGGSGRRDGDRMAGEAPVPAPLPNLLNGSGRHSPICRPCEPASDSGPGPAASERWERIEPTVVMPTCGGVAAALVAGIGRGGG